MTLESVDPAGRTRLRGDATSASAVEALTAAAPPGRPEESAAPPSTRGATRTRVTVIVPTRNEAANVEPLLSRLEPALAGQEAEVIFVDDSDDSTPEVVQHRAAQDRPGFAVRLLHRAAGHRAGGLGTAVAAGLAAAGGEWAVVMDGDLQHPPELVPRLIQAGEDGGVAVVVASRHVAGGASDGLSGRSRVFVSDSATRLAKAMFPYGLRGVSDPMSGYFAVRRSEIDVSALRPDGFKILMEILVRSPRIKRSEIGFVFEDRLAGESKASFAEGLRFFRHLARLSLRRLVNG